MKRRKFITTLSGAAVAAPFFTHSKARAASLSGDVPVPDTVTLGNTGLVTTRMAQGTGVSGGRMQSNQTRAGFDSFVNLIRHGYDRGIRFFDLADQYGTHIYFREALRFIPREDVTILTKFQYRFDGKEALNLDFDDQKRSARNAIERYRKELDVDTLDVVLMHNVVTPRWDEDCAGYIEALLEAKENGQIRAVGMSCHTLHALKRAAELEWVQVAFTRINPYGVIMDGPVDDVMPVQRKFKERGASVVGMKIFGAGRLTDKRDECMRFAQNLGYLDGMTIGAETPAQIDENLRLMAKYPAKA